MYAIIEAGGKQHRVEEGRWIDIELIPEGAGDKVKFDKVLLVVDGDKSTVGAPYVKGAKVEAEVVKHGLGRKVIVYKMRPKKHYRRKAGHRQAFTRVMITKVSAK